MRVTETTSPKEFIDNFKRNRPPTTSLEQFLPFAAAFLSCVDGEVHENEIKKIHDIGKKFLGKNFNKKQLYESFESLSVLLDTADEIVYSKWESVTLDTFSKMNLSSEGEKQALLAFFCELAFADGSVHKKEVQFIDKLSDAINFNNPFELVADHEQENTPSIEPEWHFNNRRASGLAAKMLSDTLIKNGLVLEERRKECLKVATSVVTENVKESNSLLARNKKLRKRAFVHLSKKILEKLS